MINGEMKIMLWFMKIYQYISRIFFSAKRSQIACQTTLPLLTTPEASLETPGQVRARWTHRQLRAS